MPADTLNGTNTPICSATNGPQRRPRDGGGCLRDEGGAGGVGRGRPPDEHQGCLGQVRADMVQRTPAISSVETFQSRSAASGSSAYDAAPRRMPSWWGPASWQSSKYRPVTPSTTGRGVAHREGDRRTGTGQCTRCLDTETG